MGKTNISSGGPKAKQTAEALMFCNQCQEAAKNVACTIKGVCGKTS